MNLSLPWLKQEAPPVKPIRGAVAVQRQVEVVPEISSAKTVGVLLGSFAFFVLIMFMVADKALALLDQPISEVSIKGQIHHLDGQALATQLAQEIRAPLLSLDVRSLRDEALANPWVHVAEVRRQWPAAIEVSIAEQVPVARWGDRGLLNHQGDIFWPDLSAGYDFLPRLNGPAHETRAIIAQYHDLSALFSTYGIRIQSLTLESRGAWNLELDNGIQVVAGREQLMPRLRRFLNIYDAQLAEVADQIEQIDIRYTNGVAVRWRTEERQDDAG
ncbi:MAG: cell division protein FtsQ/DivIB [Nitrincola sp.]|nr:cell division protein FtsQ/DivIB [Nitrincola sp.]